MGMSPFRRLWNTLRRSRLDDELRQEVETHLALIEEEELANGLSAKEAEQRARSRFGSPLVHRRRALDAVLATWLEEACQDVRFAARQLRKTPGYTIVAVVTLALGIGANAAMFSIVNSVLLEPMKYRDVERLYSIVNLPPPAANLNRYLKVNARHFHEWRLSCRSCEDVAIAERITLTLTGSGEPEAYPALRVSYNFFRTLGVQPNQGRDFRSDEELPGRFNEIVLADSVWRVRFASDPRILGSTLQVNGQDHVVVGIMPPNFSLPVGNQWGSDDFGPPVQPVMFRPLGMDVSQARPIGTLNFISVVRVAPGVDPVHTSAELTASIDDLARESGMELRPLLLPLQETVTRNARVGLWLLLSTVGVLLVIVCVNVGTLMLERTASRYREVGIRMALGSSRAALFGLVMSEAVVLVLVGSGLGFLLAQFLVSMFPRWGPVDLPRVTEIQMGWRVLLFTAATAALSTFICGAFPAWRLSRADPHAALGTEIAAASARFREVMVTMQVALSTVLLIIGALLSLSLLRLMSVPKGFEASRVLTYDVSLIGAKYRDRDRILLIDEALRRLEATPGVLSVGIANQLPAMGEAFVCELRDGGPPEQIPVGLANFRFVSAGYWSALGISLKKGRLLHPNDRGAVAVVSQRVTELLWPGEDPIGKRIGPCGKESAPGVLEVVGVVDDVRAQLEQPAPPTVYQPYWHAPIGRPYFVIRTQGDSKALANETRTVLRSMSPDLRVSLALSMEQVLDDATAVRRLQSYLANAFAVVALFVASFGIYGTLAYLVTRRTKEIGIRLALGARRFQVMALVMRQNLWLVVVGIVVGLVVAGAVTTQLRSLLFEISPLDLWTFVHVALLFGTVAALSSYVPARRATEVDPISAIRSE
jgi:putative ABC transport system permease protein